MKLEIKTSYISAKTSSNSYNVPHTNMIQYSFKIEAKVMGTSDSMAWECKSFTYGFLGFRPTENRDIKLKIKSNILKHGGNIWNTNAFPKIIKLK